MKSKTMVCLPALQLRPLPHGALEVEQIVEEHDLAPSDAEFAFAQEQTVAAEAPALGHDHAFRTALGNLDLGSDGIGLVQDVRGSAGRHAGQFARIGEDRSSRREARTRRIPARECRVIERQHVVLLRLGIEEVLHLLELVRHLGGQVVGLGRVLLDVIKLPLVPGDHIRRRLGAQLPRKRHRRRGRHPPVVIDGAIAEHLEILRRVSGRGVGVRLIPGIHHAYPFDGALLDAVDHHRAAECRSLRGWSARYR